MQIWFSLMMTKCVLIMMSGWFTIKPHGTYICNRVATSVSDFKYIATEEMYTKIKEGGASLEDVAELMQNPYFDLNQRYGIVRGGSIMGMGLPMTWPTFYRVRFLILI